MSDATMHATANFSGNYLSLWDRILILDAWHAVSALANHRQRIGTSRVGSELENKDPMR